MNEYDSNRILDLVKTIGYVATQEPAEADEGRGGPSRRSAVEAPDPRGDDLRAGHHPGHPGHLGALQDSAAGAGPLGATAS